MIRSVAVVLAAVVSVGLMPHSASAQATVPANIPASVGGGGNATNFDMAPETSLAVVNAALAQVPDKIPDGPVKPDWDSIRANYKVPAWFYQAKFGIFMHWGLYTVPAYAGGGASEWYLQHLYGGANSATARFHIAKYGPLEKFGYKDFIPLFTAAKWNPDAWAILFKKSGAKYIVPTAQHHEGFANWDSQVAPWNAMKMGPHRDLIGDLSKAVRAQGLKFGVSNHGIENFQFIHISPALAADLKAKKADLYDPAYQDFYHVMDRSDAACQKFLTNWVQRNVELIDKYQPDMLWFDNGVDMRYLDPLKEWIAAYYYNRAATWGKEVSISTKKAAYAPGGNNVDTIGSIIDFEKIGTRSPSGIRTGAWQVDQPIGSNWGYATTMTVSGAGAIVGDLVDTVSKNGNLLLNISPTAEGEIPQAQQDTLLAIGAWLDVNGEAIYGSHNWIKYGEGMGARGETGTRFTVKGDDLYAIILGQWPGQSATIQSLGSGAGLEGKITSVTMLGSAGELQFSQDASGLKVTLPAAAPCKYAYVLKISGLKMNAEQDPASGNPVLPE